MANEFERENNYAVEPPDGYQWCPLKWKSATDLGVVACSACDGPRCAWWDSVRERCGVLPDRRKL